MYGGVGQLLQLSQDSRLHTNLFGGNNWHCRPTVSIFGLFPLSVTATIPIMSVHTMKFSMLFGKALSERSNPSLKSSLANMWNCSVMSWDEMTIIHNTKLFLHNLGRLTRVEMDPLVKVGRQKTCAATRFDWAFLRQSLYVLKLLFHFSWTTYSLWTNSCLRKHSVWWASLGLSPLYILLHTTRTSCSFVTSLFDRRFRLTTFFYLKSDLSFCEPCGYLIWQSYVLFFHLQFNRVWPAATCLTPTKVALNKHSLTCLSFVLFRGYPKDGHHLNSGIYDLALTLLFLHQTPYSRRPTHWRCLFFTYQVWTKALGPWNLGNTSTP